MVLIINYLRGWPNSWFLQLAFNSSTLVVWHCISGQLVACIIGNWWPSPFTVFAPFEMFSLSAWSCKCSSKSLPKLQCCGTWGKSKYQRSPIENGSLIHSYSKRWEFSKIDWKTPEEDAEWESKLLNDHPGQITEELNLKIICQQVLLSVIHNQRVKVANRRQLFDNLTKSDCKLTNFDCKLTNSNCKLTNSDCNLTNSDCKFIPHICHERHEHARVNFFGRSKFLQI